MERTYVVIKKSEFVLELHTDDGVRRYPVAIGSNPDGGDKLREGDCRTPEGEFEIESVEDSSDWEEDGARAYGPMFLRLSCAPWKGIGIHGTDRPDLVGTRSTRGCIRMRNEELYLLVNVVGVGTLVSIVP